MLCQDGEEETDEEGDQDEAGEQEATAVPDDAVEDGEILPSGETWTINSVHYVANSRLTGVHGLG